MSSAVGAAVTWTGAGGTVWGKCSVHITFAPSAAGLKIAVFACTSIMYECIAKVHNMKLNWKTNITVSNCTRLCIGKHKFSVAICMALKLIRSTPASIRQMYYHVLWSHFFNYTRNTHAHLCLAPVRYTYMRPVAGEARVARVTIAVGAVFAVRSIQTAMAPLHRQRTLLSAINIWVERIWMCQTAWRTHSYMVLARCRVKVALRHIT